jgi:hypothetical protein
MTTPTTPRPKNTDDEIIRAAAVKLTPRVQEWLKQGGDDMDEIDVVDDLAKAMRFESDGYGVARELDHAGWSPDAHLVDILDGTYQMNYDALTEACKAWVIATGAQEIPVGSIVLWKKHSWPAPKEGVVTKNRAEGKSVVSFDGETVLGYIIEWEKLEVKP